MFSILQIFFWCVTFSYHICWIRKFNGFFALGGFGAWWSCGSLAGRGVRQQKQSVFRYQLSVFLGVAMRDTSSSCGNVDVDVYQNSPWNFTVVLCISLEGLHCFSWFWTAREICKRSVLVLNAGLPLATQQLLVICQRVLPKARQYPVQSAIYI